MSDFAIRTRNLTKVYRLYAKTYYRFLDMFGLLRKKDGAFTEHAALDNINLEIKRGEKVAIIGRNGAGKSTFLKLVSNVIAATSGQIEVKGEVHALLEIGTGFHPDFTGRENVYSYLAHLGLTGGNADRKVEEVIEYAELEEYIDQPMKTYSTGMGVRLMFATSTAITPDILVLDEVLGVGDAYFAQKSFKKMEEMAKGAGTTLLLVTHDVYSAIKLCERVIWVDRGRILMDGNGKEVSKAYEDSIRQQEEQRLRKKKLESLKRIKKQKADEAFERVLIEIQSKDNKPQQCPVYFSRIALLRKGDVVSSLPLGPEAFDSIGSAHLQKDIGCWGDMVEWEGRLARPILNYGSSFHKVAGVLTIQKQVFESNLDEFQLAIDYWSEQSCNLIVRAFYKDKEYNLGFLPQKQKEWIEHIVSVGEHFSEKVCTDPPSNVNKTGIQGTGMVRITDIKLVNSKSLETHHLKHGEPVSVLIDYRIMQRDLQENAQVLVAFHRDGIQDVCRVITRDLFFDGVERRCATIRLCLLKMRLGTGRYTLTVMIAREGYYDEEQTNFFSINPGVYCCASKVLEFEVTGGGMVAAGTAVVFDGRWDIVD